MRFSIRRTFSLLQFHRRSKSETSATAFEAPPFTDLPHSLSLNDVDELASDDASIPLVPGSYPFPPGPLPVSAPTVRPLAHATSVFAPVAAPAKIDSSPKTDYVAPVPSAKKAPRSARPSALPGRVSRLVSDLAAVNQRIILLEAENAQLKEEHAAITLDATIVTGELVNYRSDFYSEQFKINALVRTETANQERYEAQDRKLFQAGKFIESMIELGLHEPVLARAWDAIRSGEDPDDALVGAIKEAATKPGSSWSRIIPAVTGPRTSDQYLSAINMALKTRKELKHSKAVANFWKKTAKKDPVHEATLTPSSSDLELINEQLSGERQTAVDDLLAGIRNGKVSFVRTPRSTGEIDTTLSRPALPFDDSSELNKTITVTRPIPPISSDIFVPPSTSTSTYHDSTRTNQQLVTELAPLASQVFKQELISSCSVSRSLIAPSKHSRPVLGNIDVNRDIRDPKSTRGSADTSKTNSKALGKRKAMIVTESIDSITASLRSSECGSIAFGKIPELHISVDTTANLIPTHKPITTSDILSIHKNITTDKLTTHKNTTTSNTLFNVSSGIPSIHKDITTDNHKNSTNNSNIYNTNYSIYKPTTTPKLSDTPRTIYDQNITTSNNLSKYRDITTSNNLSKHKDITTVYNISDPTAAAERLSTISERSTYSTSPSDANLLTSTSLSILPPLGENHETNIGTLSAERALLSLERICAGFGSGSLGSLRTINEESGEDECTLNATATSAFTSKTLNSSSRSSRMEKSVAFSDDDDESILGNTSASSAVSTPFSSPVKNGRNPPHKRSMLPVFKNLRRLSGSLSPSKKSSSTSPPPSLIQRPTTSSALKTTTTMKPAPLRKPVSPLKPALKPTAPLVIKKKSKLPTTAPAQSVVALIPTPTIKAKTQLIVPKSSAPRIAPPVAESRGRRAVRTLSRIIS